MNSKNIIYFSIGLILSSQVFAQSGPSPLFSNVPSSNSFDEPVNKNKKVDISGIKPKNLSSDYSSEELNKLNGYLSQQDYVVFFEYIQTLTVNDKSYINFLLSKKYDGHVPLYWLMADYYAQHDMELETHKWLYIATIMTEQDSYLCSDGTSKYAAQKLNRAFPKAMDVTRKTPQYISSVMPEVIYFIQNLKQRSDPKWACNFGDNTVPPGYNVTIPQTNWKKQRDIIFKRFTDKYQQ